MAENRKMPIAVSLVLVSIIFLVGTTALGGYIFRIRLLAAFTKGAAMNPFTAICFVFISSWMYAYLLYDRLARKLEFFIGGLVIIVAMLKLLEYLGILSLHLNEWLFRNEVFSNEEIINNSFNLIAPNSALLLLFCGFIIFSVSSTRHAVRLLADTMKVVGFLFAYLAIVGYLFDLERAYKMGESVPMALNNAIGYLAFFTVALIEMPPGNFMRVIGSRYTGGRLARTMIPYILIVPLLFGYLRLAGERHLFYSTSFGTAMETVFTIFMILLFVYLYARRLNAEDKTRHAAEQQIADSEQKYRTLVNALREGVIYYDVHGVISFCNKSFSTITGYDESEIIGINILELFGKEEQVEKYKGKLRDRRMGISEVHEDVVRDKFGNSKWLSISACPVMNDNGDIIAAMSTIVDITEKRKQMEDIEAFSASAAHDLSAPLSRVEMLATVLQDTEREHMQPESATFLDSIVTTTAGMRKLLKDLLQFSRLGVSNIDRSIIDTNGLVTEAVESCRHINPKATINMKDMPQVQGDRPMLRQVFTNLISNALKYTSRLDHPEVEIGSFNTEEDLVIYVKDNGEGFNMTDAHKLFVAFQRLHHDYEGNGMGLPIVKRIIEKHGGRIWVEGRPGEGATFFFTLS